MWAPTASWPGRSFSGRSIARAPSTSHLESGPIDGAVAYVQYAKPRAKLETNTARFRLFLTLGVLGGTLLAFLAGLNVAGRAMRPIADLTRAAREVARTRDPALTLPKPQANDEVADLANTLEHMLQRARRRQRRDRGGAAAPA